MISCMRSVSCGFGAPDRLLRSQLRSRRLFTSMHNAAPASEHHLEAPEFLARHGIKSLSPDCPVSHILEGLADFTEESLQGASAYVRPTSLLFDQAGKARRWDAVQAHASVAVVLYHRDWQAFVVVRQFRPAVYAVKWRAAKAAGQPPPPFTEGLTFELCAGILDKPGKSLQQISCEEILEEVGYRVEPDQLICCADSVISSAGITGAPQTIFLAEVDESMRVSPGGGTMCVKERVEALSLPLASIDKFIADTSIAKTPGLCFGLIWARHWLQQQKEVQQ